MPIKIKSAGGGSITIDVPSTAVDTTVLLPTANGVGLFSNNSPVLTGNVAVSGANSYININGVSISPYIGMMKNRIINGDFRIDQRFAGAANNNIVGSQYAVDRWFSYGNQAGKLRFQQNNTNGPGQAVTQAATGFPYYFGANTFSSNTVTASDAWLVGQGIEGYNTADLAWGTANASPVTISFWVYSSIPGTHGARLGNNAADRSYPFTYTINAANTWQFQTITIPGDITGTWLSNTSVGIYLFYDLGTGSSLDGTNNTWQSGNKYPVNIVQPVTAANGSFYITGVQLEKGLQATAFDFRHYTTELSLCQRYYCKSYDIATAPGTATQSNMVGGAFQGASGLGGAYGIVQFPLVMRAAPTVTLWDGAGTTNVLSYTYGAAGSGQSISNGGAVWGTGGALNVGTASFMFRPTGAQASSLAYTHYAASAEVNVSN